MVRRLSLRLCSRCRENHIFVIKFSISVYNTCSILKNKEKYVDASDNAISDNESSSEMLTSQSQIPECAKNR